MEQLPHGRHAARQKPTRTKATRTKATPTASRTKATRARAPRASAMRPEAAGPTRVTWAWIIVVGLISAAIGAALTLQGHEKHSVLDASGNANGPLYGSSASNPSDLGRATSQFGHMPIIRVFYPGLPSPDAWTSGAPGINRSAVIVSFNALPSAILSGSDDAALSHFFDTAPTGHPIYYSYYHEPEPHIVEGQFSLSDYKAAWKHIVTLADAAHNADLQSTLILTSWTVNPASGRNFRNYLPSGAVISTLGWDAYPAGTVENHDPQLTPPANFMGPEVAAARSVGLPFGFAEFALGTATGRPGWLTEVGNYLARSGALFGTLFDSSGFPTMQLNDGASITAWRDVVARSGSTVPLAPPVTPTPTSAPRPTGPSITGLAASPATFATDGHGHARLTFTLSQPADITVCVLGPNGAVVHQMARPSRSAGSVTVSYYGYDGGHRIAPGRYPVLVVASNSHGSTTAETVLTITAP